MTLDLLHTGQRSLLSQCPLGATVTPTAPGPPFAQGTASSVLAPLLRMVTCIPLIWKMKPGETLVQSPSFFCQVCFFSKII